MSGAEGTKFQSMPDLSSPGTHSPPCQIGGNNSQPQAGVLVRPTEAEQRGGLAEDLWVCGLTWAFRL